MTALSACQSAMIRLVGRKPNSVFSSQDQMELEIADLANEAAIAIARAHDWQALTNLMTQAGDASSTAFALPADYDRMPIKGDVHSSRWEMCRFLPAVSLDQWLDLQTSLPVGSPGVW